MDAIAKYDSVTLTRKDYPVLRDVSFTVDAGEFIYVTGRVGSGKSTLLRSMFADIKISSGKANVLGYDLTKVTRKEIPYLRRKIGFVFQDFRLLDDRDIFSNLDFVMDVTGESDANVRHERIDYLLQMVGMADKSYKMPHELSGGEQQRIAVVRALLNRPKLILADEPTADLDDVSGDFIIRMLHSATRSGASVIVATHNHRLIDQYPGRHFYCENQQLITS